ncbi:MAG: [acyl-carrier-protein] S-malonyltransferase [Halobacteriovoraceae bacterium]|nr:[acyl-carrier-protein] S-malonyltransferase [Halobacteriovoraceae bacterium]|tara:strand:+ start:220955 stop:221908 length:954 start_codon:yes stop_codon:yes gene_type:complete
MVKSVTLVFPGQGAQYVGMGSSLEGHPSSQLLDQANSSLGYDLKNMMLNGPEEDLTLTANTQPAILTYSVALYQKLEELLQSKGVKVDRVLGHSVGEYAALVAAKSLSFEDAVKAVNLRGTYMQEAVPAGKGKMVAVMKVPMDTIVKVCEECSQENNEVMPANFNEPGQTVISGHAEACDRFVKWMEDNYSEPYRCVELKVSAPFHSSLMKPAAEKLSEHFNTIEFKSTMTPYIANIDAKEYGADTAGDMVKENLIKQVDGSVKWTQSIQALPDDTVCVEVGPGRVLMGLIRKINRNIKVISLDKEGAFEELEELLG